MTELTVGVRCGHCAGPLYMLTCNSFHGSGHNWTVASVCGECRAVHWTEDGCLDCAALASEHALDDK